ncbi:hypothetical protein A0H81_10765 [Grifola frondosa]|uniref:Uncharacterized protein n=1 Tax=Grifola frondosa TaxID=5627 RepID=A0A1C7LWY5_GRIFR|nr:hypothetical protein A0H81_10765 [Grifola frondosa]
MKRVEGSKMVFMIEKMRQDAPVAELPVLPCGTAGETYTSTLRASAMITDALPSEVVGIEDK